MVCLILIGLRGINVFATHLYHQNPDHRTPEESYFKNCAISLGRYLKDNKFLIKMDVPKRERVPEEARNWKEWLDYRFKKVNTCTVQSVTMVTRVTQ